MTLADFQKYLRALADALTTAKGSGSKELTEAADALTPFTHHTMAEFAKFLSLAEQTYRDGVLPKPPPLKPPPPPRKVTVEQFQTTIQGIEDRIKNGADLKTEEVVAELAKFNALTKPQLDGVAHGLGYKARIKSKKEAMEKIVEFLCSPVIADARSRV